MGRLQVKTSVLLCWALTVTVSPAQREYFIQPVNRTWSDARNYCQACFQELVTLTPDNIQDIARNINSDHWIGLRKTFNFNNATDNLTSTPASYTVSYITTHGINSNFTSNDTSSPVFNWTHWANGDPLAFQNWYPGWPLPKPSPKPPNRTVCCSCSCTCPARPTTPATTPATTPNTTSFNNFGNVTDAGNMTNTATSFIDLTGNTGQTMTTQSTSPSFTTTSPPWTTAEMPIEAACVRSPMLEPEEPEEPEDDDSNGASYIEDSCVAMLSFGPWIERNCLDRLPFICYEDRFNGRVNVTNITSDRANLTWLRAPGNIDHYRLEVTNGMVDNETVQTDLTHELNSLTAGTHYSVQVIPVKCGRDLNPEKASFYTIPNKVTGLNISSMTTTSISLSWNKPQGNLDFYNLTYRAANQTMVTTAVTDTSKNVSGLTPGTLYNFTIISEVSDGSQQSDKVNISGYTYPDKVYNLTVSDNTDHSFLVTWNRPRGSFDDILVEVNSTGINVSITYINPYDGLDLQNVTVGNLTAGAEIHVNVTVRVNKTIVGETQSIYNYTTPGPISNLNLTSTNNALSATWSPPSSGFSSFTVKLNVSGSNVNCTTGLTDRSISFYQLKNGANYTVEVRAVSGIFESSPVSNFTFTLPNPPHDVEASDIQTHNITYKWKPPDNTLSPNYSVILSSSFWGQTWSHLINTTSYTFTGLESGTNYSFEVRTVAGNGQRSPPVGCANYTVADIREVSLAMLCTSPEPLLCDGDVTRTNVFDQLKQLFGELLNGSITWDLQETFK